LVPGTEKGEVNNVSNNKEKKLKNIYIYIYNIPLDGLVLADLVVDAEPGPGVLAPGHADTGPLEDNVEVHAVDTGGGVILEPKVNVLRDAKAKVARLGKVLLLELKLLDLQAALKELSGLIAANGHVASDLLVP
jgi:hypothetical protein